MSEPNDPLEDLRRLMYERGQAAMAFEDQQAITQKALKLAAETLDLADQLGASADPHRERLAASVKNTVVGAFQEHITHPTAAKAGREPEAAAPFLDGSPTSPTLLPGPSTKALPQKSKDQKPPKRGRGRPRKEAQE